MGSPDRQRMGVRFVLFTSAHCVATLDANEEYSETDLIIINNFMSTLAEIALAVAARQRSKPKE